MGQTGQASCVVGGIPVSLIRAWLVLLAGIAMLACGELRREQVVGEYRGNLGEQRILLDLKPNGLFVWIAEQPDKPVTRREGRWLFSSVRGGAGIVLQELPARAGAWSQQYVIETLLGRIWIEVDPHLGRSLYRQ
jgi:hypothetical protein